MSRFGSTAKNPDVEVGESAIRQLVQWIELVVGWVRKIDLRATRTIDALVDLCIANANAQEAVNPGRIAVLPARQSAPR